MDINNLALNLDEIIKNYPKTGLVIVGSGAEKENLKFKIKNLKLQDSVRLEPWTEDLASYYKSADLFLLTSNYEGWGLAIVEAMASGCPVVMTDVGCAGELLKDEQNGLVIPVADRQKLEEAIIELRTDNDLAARLKKMAQETAAALADKEEYLRRYKESWQQSLNINSN